MFDANDRKSTTGWLMIGWPANTGCARPSMNCCAVAGIVDATAQSAPRQAQRVQTRCHGSCYSSLAGAGGPTGISIRSSPKKRLPAYSADISRISRSLIPGTSICSVT